MQIEFPINPRFCQKLFCYGPLWLWKYNLSSWWRSWRRLWTSQRASQIVEARGKGHSAAPRDYWSDQVGYRGGLKISQDWGSIRRQCQAEIGGNAPWVCWYLFLVLWRMPGLDTYILVHKFLLKEDCTPVKQKLRRTHPETSKKIKEEVQKQFDAGFLKVISYLPWIANIVSVPKKDGKVRMCVDYRELNRASPKDDFYFLILTL